MVNLQVCLNEMIGSTEQITQNFLSSVRIRQEALQEHSLSRPPENFQSAVDISIGLEQFPNNIESILKTTKESGYNGVSLGCQSLKNVYQRQRAEGINNLKKKIENSGLKIDIFHGGWDYTQEGLRGDWEVMKIIDPDENCPVNYESVELDFPSLLTSYNENKDLDQIRVDQRKKIGKSQKQQVTYIAEGVKEAREDSKSKRKVLFEMPSGTFTSEGRPEQMHETVDILTKILGAENNYWGITVDTGHLFGTVMSDKSNASPMQNRLGRIALNLIKAYPDRVGALHIVASLTATSSAYSSALGEKLGKPQSAMGAIDMHGAPDSIAHLILIDEIRKVMSQHPQTKVIEVAEIGIFASGLVGFGLNEKEDLEKEYLQDIKIQASLLGY